MFHYSLHCVMPRNFVLQAYEFFLFAGIMFVDMIILGWMATRYTYVDYSTHQGVIEDDEDNEIKMDE